MDRDDSRNRDGVRAAISPGLASAFLATDIPLKQRKKPEPEGRRKPAGNRLAIFLRTSGAGRAPRSVNGPDGDATTVEN
jgi:hypothetical protein